MSELESTNGNTALAQMTDCYKALVRDFGVRGQFEALEDSSVSCGNLCVSLVGLISL